MRSYIFGLVLATLGVSVMACGDSGPSTGGGGQSNGGSGGGGDGGQPGGGSSGSGPQIPPVSGELVINELMSQNEGAWIDEAGEADDWVELANRSDHTLSLADCALNDASEGAFALPDRALAPGESVLIWVDSDPD
ncbi:MAG TPA: lamin tail domain-containing protein, partial [Polyangiaceae bacterium]|nr:lamin tail domain-containing protein [Polyangiaceae bacterium]